MLMREKTVFDCYKLTEKFSEGKLSIDFGEQKNYFDFEILNKSFWIGPIFIGSVHDVT